MYVAPFILGCMTIEPVPADPENDHPDIERVDYPEPEEGVTQNDDAQSGVPDDEGPS